MARLSALLLMVLSLLAVAHCRSLEAEPATEVESSAVVAAGDENGPREAEAAVLPTEQQQQSQHGLLRLPSHRFHRHRPCRHGLFHRHLWWARHHGPFGDSPRRFHHRHIEVPSAPLALAVLPADETTREAAGEVKAVAEPDPDRSLPESDGEGELDEEGHEQEDQAAEGLKLKRFHHHHNHHDEDEEEGMTRKRFRHAEHDDDSDSDDEDDEVEEMVRRFRKAIMRSRFGHGPRFHHHRHHHHYGHRHAEEAENADAQDQEGGVVSWIKGLMNRF